MGDTYYSRIKRIRTIRRPIRRSVIRVSVDLRKLKMRSRKGNDIIEYSPAPIDKRPLTSVNQERFTSGSKEERKLAIFLFAVGLVCVLVYLLAIVI